MAAEDDDTDINEEDGVPRSMRGGIYICGCWLNGACGEIGIVAGIPNAMNCLLGGDELRYSQKLY